MKRLRLTVVFVAANLALLAVSVLYVCLFLDSESLAEPLIVCRFKETFLCYCPGCGGTRAVAALLKFDFLNSFIYNPTVIVAALIFLDVDLRTVVSLIKGNPRYIKSIKPIEFLIIPAVLLVNFLVRNILLFGFGIDLLGDLLCR